VGGVEKGLIPECPTSTTPESTYFSFLPRNRPKQVDSGAILSNLMEFHVISAAHTAHLGPGNPATFL